MMIVLLMMRRTTAMIPTTTMTTTGRRHKYWDSYVMNKVMRDDVRALFNDSCRIAEHTNQQIRWNTCWSIQLERSVITDYWKQADWQMERRSNNDKTCSQFPKKYRHPIYEYWLYNYNEWCMSDGWFCHKQLKRDKHYGMSHIPGLHTMFDILKNMRETKCDYWPGELEQYPENNWNTFILDGFPLLKLPFGVMSARPVHLW